MKKRLFVGVGVQAPAGMEPLPGVCDAVRRLGDYAAQNDSYDDPILFLDDEGTVKADAIKAALPKDVLRDRPRIVWYFCGHGAFLNGAEIWYLSEGWSQWSQRVDVAQLRDILRTYGPRQISIFSDACQTAVTHDAHATPILDADTGRKRPFQLDVFRATVEGKAAFATKRDGPLFSKVIGEVLTGDTPEEALDRLYLRFNSRVVTSQSLGDYVEMNLPDYVALAGKEQFPQINTGLRPEQNDYLKLGTVPGAREVELEAASAASADEHVTVRPPRNPQAVREASLSEWRQGFWGTARDVITRKGLEDMIVVGLPMAHGDGALMLHVPGGSAARESFDLDRGSGYRFVALDAPRNARWQKQPAVLQAGDLWMPLQCDTGEALNLVLYVDELDTQAPGITALGWHPPYDVDYVDLDPIQAIKGLLTGAIGPSMIPELAANLRQMKHVDPLYGIVAAHLYDRVNDVDSIHRMCLFYSEHGQKVPFDLALLGELPLRRATGGGFTVDVPSVKADPAGDRAGLPQFAWQEMAGQKGLPVAGIGPILQTTWTRFTSPIHGENAVPPGDLTPAPFATFHGESGKRLVTYLNALFPT